MGKSTGNDHTIKSREIVFLMPDDARIRTKLSDRLFNIEFAVRSGKANNRNIDAHDKGTGLIVMS